MQRVQLTPSPQKVHVDRGRSEGVWPLHLHGNEGSGPADPRFVNLDTQCAHGGIQFVHSVCVLAPTLPWADCTK